MNSFGDFTSFLECVFALNAMFFVWDRPSDNIRKKLNRSIEKYLTASEASATDLDEKIHHIGRGRFEKFEKISQIILVFGRRLAISSALIVLLFLFYLENNTPIHHREWIFLLLALPPFATLLVLVAMRYLFRLLNWKDFSFIRNHLEYPLKRASEITNSYQEEAGAEIVEERRPTNLGREVGK